MPKPRMTAQDIYQRLREMILDFDLFPGTRVTEQELANKFKVSRTPIRQALQRLEAEGHLKIMPKQGCFIRPVDIETITEYYDLRVALEAMAVELACEKMSDVELEALSTDWDPVNRIAGKNSAQHISLIEESFHMRIAHGSGNKVLGEYLNNVNDRIRIIRRLGFPDDKSIEETYEEHHEICKLLLKRDKRRAKDAMIKHIRKSQSIAKTVTLSQLEKHRKQTKLTRKKTSRKNPPRVDQL